MEAVQLLKINTKQKNAICLANFRSEYFFRFSYTHARQTWKEIIIYWIAFPCERICSRLTIDEVKMLIAKDETLTPELKKVPDELHRGMETDCAFLDSDGGVAG